MSTTCVVFTDSGAGLARGQLRAGHVHVGGGGGQDRDADAEETAAALHRVGRHPGRRGDLRPGRGFLQVS